MACEDCHLLFEDLLTDKQKKQVPFHGNEQIIFKDGQTKIKFDGQGIFDTIYTEYSSAYSCDWNTREHYNIVFSSDNRYIKIFLIGKNRINVKILESIYNSGYLSSMIIDAVTAELSNYMEFIDSLNMADHIYYSIYKDTLVNVGLGELPDSIKHPVYSYYSTEFGLIKVDFSDGSAWELQEIIWQE